MAKIASRRTMSSREPTFSRRPKASRRCSTSGITMSFDTMIDSATVSTITMAVAADSPPTNAAMGRTSQTACRGRAGREGQQTGQRDGDNKQVDRQQVERKQPRGTLDLAFIVVLYHRDMELPRQQNDGDER